MLPFGNISERIFTHTASHYACKHTTILAVLLIFFSPAGIQSLMKNFPDFEQKDIAIGSFGPTTAQAVKDEIGRAHV